ncbi:Lactonase, 7-bladed beta-propeller-domain-containing protein, partial [Phakopsora pachyrhizi]
GEIDTLRFDFRSNKFVNISKTAGADSAGKDPNFFAMSPDKRFLFVADGILDFGGRKNTGAIYSFKVLDDGRLRRLSSSTTAGGPVSIDVSADGKKLIVACYMGASATRHSVDENGLFTSERPLQTFTYHHSGPNSERQTQSYIHQAKYDPTGKLALFTDLGGDRVYIHSVVDSQGTLSQIAHEIVLPPGTGPRHLSIVEVQKNNYGIYLICELSNQVIYLKLSKSTGGKLDSKIIQTLSTLPKEFQSLKAFGAGEIEVSKDGRFVYGSNRQTDFKRPITDNSIVMFRRDPQTGLLDGSNVKFFPIEVGGKVPGHFSLSNDKNQGFMTVGCYGADTLLIYSRDADDGEIRLLGSTGFVRSPSVQLFL